MSRAFGYLPEGTLVSRHIYTISAHLPLNAKRDEHISMDINAGLADQRVNAIVKRLGPQIVAILGPQAKNDPHKVKSAAFTFLAVQSLLVLDDDKALDCLTDGGQDAGVDALHIGDVVGDDFNVTLFQSKYAQSLDGNKGFPANSIVRIISTIRQIFDPSKEPSLHSRLEELVAEVRSLIQDGKFPDVRVILCNNGQRWEADGQREIDLSGLAAKRVSFQHFNHDKLVEIARRHKVVDARLRLTGKGTVDQFDHRRVLVGRLPVTEVKRLFDEHGDPLLDRNIRRYLGLKDNRVNKGIHDTLVNPRERANFYFFNNGITAVCNKFTHTALQDDDWSITAKDLQIVNGGQTCKTIQQTLQEYSGEDYSKTHVLLRLYELASENDTLINNITFATNSQNPVDLTDLRSNDPLQERLALGLSDLGFEYKRKRDDQIASGADVITSSIAAEAVMAVWRRRPNAAKFRQTRLFSDHYDEVFTPDLQPAHVVLSVLAFRHVESERKRPKQKRPKFVPYASHFLAMVLGDLLLQTAGVTRAQVSHVNLAQLRELFTQHRTKLYDAAVSRVLRALRRFGITNETTLPRVAAQFRRGDLLEPLQAALSGPNSASRAARSKKAPSKEGRATTPKRRAQSAKRTRSVRAKRTK